MKTMKLAIAAATILAVCAGTTWTVAAETSPAQAPARGKAPCRWTDGKAMNADYHLAKMTERFKLSDEQKTKIKPILDENYKQQQAVRADQKLTRDQRRAKMQELRTQLHEKIKPILTPEQYKLAAERWSAAGKHRQYHHGKRFKRTGYHAGHYRLNPDEHLAKMTECLKLSDEQKTKIKPILDEN
ncbi:MAG TPA: hypothetical protein PLI53_00420, partial [Geobacteraceae bacterium]|nr:hypothetical protein [Geobacteraceae bacterium]